MNYVELHLGDWAQAVAHLSMLEEASYLRLLRRYYADERPLPPDLAACQRLAGARTQDEREAVAVVLGEFFTLTDDGYRNKRADEEIAKVYTKKDKAAASAKARWNAPASENDANAMRPHSERNATACETHSERNAHQSPDTSNQTRAKKEQGARAAPLVLPEWLDPEAWAKWHRYRNAGPKWTHDARRLSLRTLTELRGQGHDPLAVIEQSIERGWTGLFPIKETSHENRRANGAGSAVERVQAAIAAGRARDAIDADFFTIDGTAVASHG